MSHNKRNNTLKELTPAFILSAISLILIIIQSITGILFNDIYSRDSVWSRAAWQGNDIVSLFIFSPLLLCALILVFRGSIRGRIFWLGIQALITYNYIYYTLAVAYNRFFLLYAAILGVSLYSLIFGIIRLDFGLFESYRINNIKKTIVCGIQFAFAGSLSALWIGQAVLFIATGQIKQEGLGMISTFDLIIVVPAMILSAIWLLKGETRGYVFSIINTLYCGLYCIALAAFTPFAIDARLPDAWTMLPLWIILCVTCLSAAGLLLNQKEG